MIYDHIVIIHLIISIYFDIIIYRNRRIQTKLLIEYGIIYY